MYAIFTIIRKIGKHLDG